VLWVVRCVSGLGFFFVVCLFAGFFVVSWLFLFFFLGCFFFLVFACWRCGYFFFSVTFVGVFLSRFWFCCVLYVLFWSLSFIVGQLLVVFLVVCLDLIVFFADRVFWFFFFWLGLLLCFFVFVSPTPHAPWVVGLSSPCCFFCFVRAILSCVSFVPTFWSSRFGH